MDKAVESSSKVTSYSKVCKEKLDFICSKCGKTHSVMAVVYYNAIVNNRHWKKYYVLDDKCQT